MRIRAFILCFIGVVAGCGGRTPIDFGQDEDDSFSGGRTGGGTSAGGSPAGGGPFGGGMPGIGGGVTGGAPPAGGTGGGGACSSDSQCFFADVCLEGRCIDGLCNAFLRDQDGDGFADGLCGGTDCNDLNQFAFPGRAEDCTDGTDNDCNGVADCFDPECSGAKICGCVPSASGEICDNGVDDDCDTTVDCNDADCFGTMTCGCGVEQCGNGLDDDCDGRLDCADSDCSSTAACQCAAKAENCTNRLDDDCDGRIDCSDAECSFSAACLCLSAQPEDCADGRDNDCDGLIDCGDPDCFADAACQGCQTETCNNGDDEDCDGLIDCEDPSCVFDRACPHLPEACNNSRDDDLDGLTDCDDPDCRNIPTCLQKQNTCLTARRIDPRASSSYKGNTLGQLSNFRGSCGGDAGEAVFSLLLTEPSRVHLDTIGSSFDTNLYVRLGSCQAGQELACDDDGGGVAWSSALDFALLSPGSYFIFVDGLVVDPDFGANEGPYVLNVEISPPVEICGDGLDNDGNGRADCVDAACASSTSCAACNGGAPAEAEFGPDSCTDGRDNDCDGLADCADSDCSASESNPQECCNGVDENGNGILDDFSCRCVQDDTCPDGQVCYTRTLGTCGIPCDQFVGEICPSLAPGSYCNETTGQCEF